mmetsp:Transcript_22581/g.57379  ORF Transcript_22581/g.57379 Transcript_22581/m.57379 type:complete len:227 (-) Transcript_22581:105-785(-)
MDGGAIRDLSRQGDTPLGSDQWGAIQGRLVAACHLEHCTHCLEVVTLDLLGAVAGGRTPLQEHLVTWLGAGGRHQRAHNQAAGPLVLARQQHGLTQVAGQLGGLEVAHRAHERAAQRLGRQVLAQPRAHLARLTAAHVYLQLVQLLAVLQQIHAQHFCHLDQHLLEAGCSITLCRCCSRWCCSLCITSLGLGWGCCFGWCSCSRRGWLSRGGCRSCSRSCSLWRHA